MLHWASTNVSTDERDQLLNKVRPDERHGVVLASPPDLGRRVGPAGRRIRGRLILVGTPVAAAIGLRRAVPSVRAIEPLRPTVLLTITLATRESEA